MADHDLAGNQGRRAIARSLAGALLAGLVLLTAAVRAGAAAEGEAADWPCQQRLVPEIAAAMIWAGPALDSVADAAADPTIRHLAGELAARRVPLEQASAQIDQFAKGLPAEHRDERLTQLFASTLAHINKDRGSIIGGIRKYAHGQQALAERVNASNEQLAQLAADQVQEREALIAQRGWDMRIYDDRRASLAYLCEQPVLLEQRAFALARAIAGHLE
jgi:hypothetical protein